MHKVTPNENALGWVAAANESLGDVIEDFGAPDYAMKTYDLIHSIDHAIWDLTYAIEELANENMNHVMQLWEDDPAAASKFALGAGMGAVRYHPAVGDTYLRTVISGIPPEMTTAEVAAMLEVEPSTVRGWAARKQFPASVSPGVWSREAVIRWHAQRIIKRREAGNAREWGDDA